MKKKKKKRKNKYYVVAKEDVKFNDTVFVYSAKVKAK